MEKPPVRPENWRKRDLIAAALRLVPGLTRVMHVAFRLSQARYTAGVVGVVLNQVGEILIVEHVFHPNWPWGLPGGWLGRAEDPAAALSRELLEETGLQITVIRPLLVRMCQSFTSHLDISYICRSEEEVKSLSSELLSYQWLKPNYMPSLLPFHADSIKVAQEQPEFEVFL